MTTLTLPVFGFFDLEISIQPRRAAAQIAADALESARSDLLDQVENGFVVEDCGVQAQVPAFAKPHLKTLIETDC